MRVIYSHYIPCTLEKHMCASILKKYAIQTGCRMAVGYEQVFKETDEETAIGLLSVRNIDVVMFSRNKIREWRKKNC